MIGFGLLLRIKVRMTTVADEFNASACLRALAAIDENLHQLVSVLTEAQFQAPPRTGGWSVGHCIEHLVLSGRAFVACWDIAMDAVPTKDSRSRKASVYQWWRRSLLRAVEPPCRFTTKTSRALMPCSRRSKAETLDRFRNMHVEVARRVEIGRELHADRIRVRSPIASWIRHPFGFSVDLALAHERRHLWQAWEVRRQLLQPDVAGR